MQKKYGHEEVMGLDEAYAGYNISPIERITKLEKPILILLLVVVVFPLLGSCCCGLIFMATTLINAQ